MCSLVCVHISELQTIKIVVAIILFFLYVCMSV